MSMIAMGLVLAGAAVAVCWLGVERKSRAAAQRRRDAQRFR